MKNYKHLILLTGISLVLTGCKGESTENSKVEESKNRTPTPTRNVYVSPLPDDAPVFNVAIEKDDYVPFEYKDEIGNFIGYDFDLMRAIGEAEGFKVKFNPLPFTEVLSSLETDKNDIAISAITVSEERLAKYSASNPYIKTGNNFLIRADADFNKVEDLVGQKISVQTGGYQARVLQEITGLEAMPVTTNFIGFQNVVMKESAALFADKTMLFSLTAQYPDHKFKVISYGEGTRLAVFTKKGNNAMIDKINSGLEKVQSSGKYQKINEKWFGEQAINIAVN